MYSKTCVLTHCSLGYKMATMKNPLAQLEKVYFWKYIFKNPQNKRFGGVLLGWVGLP